MSPFGIAAILALVAYAIYKQTQKHEIVRHGRYKLAITYAIVALCIGGFSRPDGLAEWSILVGSLALSVVFGIARGRRSNVWRDPDGRVYSQGTVLTITLFLILVAAKFAIGTVCYLTGVSDDGGFGEVMLMIAVMVAFQAELVWRRARALGARTSSRRLARL
jgi:hypothetical protein